MTPVSLSIFISAALTLLSTAHAQTASKIKTEEEIVRENMIVISRQLGVTCTTCHNPSNFKGDGKMEFKVAKEHMKITQMLIDNGMDGKRGPKASCYMCHRGQIKPVYKEPISEKK